MKKDAFISIAVDSDTKRRLEKIAETDQRSLAAVIRRLLTDALPAAEKKHGITVQQNVKTVISLILALGFGAYVLNPPRAISSPTPVISKACAAALCFVAFETVPIPSSEDPRDVTPRRRAGPA